MEKKLSVDERISKGQVHASFIVEILGAPKEHVEKTLRDYISMLKKDDGLFVVSEQYSSTKPKDNLFTLFVELELWLRDLPKVIEFCLDALPSSVEILDPQSLVLRSTDISGLLNDLQAKLHDYDFKLKDANATNQLLARNSSALMKNFIFLSLKGADKTIDEVAKDMGISSRQLKPFIDIMVKKKELGLDGNKYKPLV